MLYSIVYDLMTVLVVYCLSDRMIVSTNCILAWWELPDIESPEILQPFNFLNLIRPFLILPFILKSNPAIHVSSSVSPWLVVGESH